MDRRTVLEAAGVATGAVTLGVAGVVLRSDDERPARGPSDRRRVTVFPASTDPASPPDYEIRFSTTDVTAVTGSGRVSTVDGEAVVTGSPETGHEYSVASGAFVTLVTVGTAPIRVVSTVTDTTTEASLEVRATDEEAVGYSVVAAGSMANSSQDDLELGDDTLDGSRTASGEVVGNDDTYDVTGQITELSGGDGLAVERY